MELAKRLKWQGDLGQLAVYLLRHDESECLEGDIPGPIKRLCGFNTEALKPLLEARFGPAPEYTPEMKAIKKAADLIDECFYLAGEWNSGNRAVESSLDNALNRLGRAMCELPGDVSSLPELFERIEREKYQSKNVADYAETNKDHR